MIALYILLVCGLIFATWSLIHDAAEANHKAQRRAELDAITPDIIEALCHIILIENNHYSLERLINEQEEILADVDSRLFERGHFPGSQTEIDSRDYDRLVTAIYRTHEKNKNVKATQDYICSLWTIA